MPHGGPASPPRWPSRRGISARRSRQPVHPPVALSPRFLSCPMATSSACRVPTLPLPSLRLMCHHSSRSIPRSRPPPLLRSSPPPTGPCGRSTHPSHSCPWPRPLISPIRTKIVSDRTGGVVARGLLAVRSAPCGKIPSRPRVGVGDGISCPLYFTLTPAVAPSALPSRIAEFARSRGRARG